MTKLITERAKKSLRFVLFLAAVAFASIQTIRAAYWRQEFLGKERACTKEISDLEDAQSLERSYLRSHLQYEQQPPAAECDHGKKDSPTGTTVINDTQRPASSQIRKELLDHH